MKIFSVNEYFKKFNLKLTFIKNLGYMRFQPFLIVGLSSLTRLGFQITIYWRFYDSQRVALSFKNNLLVNIFVIFL